jgi:hypothetical protein
MNHNPDTLEDTQRNGESNGGNKGSWREIWVWVMVLGVLGYSAVNGARSLRDLLRVLAWGSVVMAFVSTGLFVWRAPTKRRGWMRVVMGLFFGGAMATLWIGGLVAVYVMAGVIAGAR